MPLRMVPSPIAMAFSWLPILAEERETEGLGNSLATRSWAVAVSTPLLAASRSQFLSNASRRAWARVSGFRRRGKVLRMGLDASQRQQEGGDCAVMGGDNASVCAFGNRVHFYWKQRAPGFRRLDRAEETASRLRESPGTQIDTGRCFGPESILKNRTRAQ